MSALDKAARGMPASDFTEGELRLFLELELITPVARTADGVVTSYALTHAGRVLTGRAWS